MSHPSSSSTRSKTTLIQKLSRQTIRVVSDDTSESFVEKMENVDEEIVNSCLCLDVTVLDKDVENRGANQTHSN